MWGAVLATLGTNRSHRSLCGGPLHDFPAPPRPSCHIAAFHQTTSQLPPGPFQPPSWTPPGYPLDLFQTTTLQAPFGPLPGSLPGPSWPALGPFQPASRVRVWSGQLEATWGPLSP